ESGELYNVEVSARNFAILYGKSGYVVHTNHYLSTKMQAIEEESEQLIGSQVRYFRALRMIRETKRHTLTSLQVILRDHVNFPYSICCHMTHLENPYDREKTISALVMDLSEKVIYMAWGNPCQNLYYPFTL
ncbi:MAG: C45 family peptidase, partial [Anaerolineales bacterium]|nr:C45 family peptidase [Anaerolineales bacterium]